jgi:3-deoxy-D-manno-octulosonate 8-phosphate phosphatase KdsC-like HAD superfamily phosphatase
MKLCGYTACPFDSNISIKKLADYTLSTKGGEGVVRELLENILKLDFIQILYSK